jgi:hypothetical protein
MKQSASFRAFFAGTIEAYLAGRIDRKEVARVVVDNVGVDDISDQDKLLSSCHWALRHMNEDGYYTTDAEVRYYFECLSGTRVFSEADRDAAIIGT